ncbi:hypothetical protein MUU53_14035 [Rhizobium lemnae]|uniref:Uncharacterized protein n=1 Tax=Rhizobium lemnae TaxID=1214924 RepID=A0ABV8E7Y5_9HYPH|nr:hypothetical protein [Rhizobium lemnae]MCJ8509033.1 hypothetical protein [Rhizobium lemnae]
MAHDLEKCEQCGKLAVSGETVTISVSEYERLTRAAAVQRISSYRAVSRSGIGLNPPLAEFILERAKTMTMAKLHEACVERFGADAPSASSIFRFVQKMRGPLHP